MRHQGRITTVSENGRPPLVAGTLYPGKVMHARTGSLTHRFEYSVFSLLVDVDRLGELGRQARILSVNKPGIVSFHERDHVENAGETLRGFADRLLQDAGIARRAARILLLAYPRIAGYAFNPISVYFAYDGDNQLIALIYAVRNTFGQRHSYVAPVLPGDITDAGVRQTRTKIFHVSPFVPMDTRYHFRIMPPGKTVRVRIQETEKGKPLLSATFKGDAVPLTTASLAGCLFRFPFMTVKVIAGIHWEALKIWLSGAKFRKSPPRPAQASYSDSGSLEAGE